MERNISYSNMSTCNDDPNRKTKKYMIKSKFKKLQMYI